MKRILVSAEMFGYGPVTTLLNVMKEFPKDSNLQFDFIGNGVALEQAKMSNFFKEYYVCNNYDINSLNHFKNIFSSYDALISSENPVCAIFGMENNIKKVYYIDNLVWMWDTIDSRLNNVTRFFISETMPCKENFNRIGKNIKHPVFVGPIRDIENTKMSKPLEKKVIINIGGASSYLLDKNLIVRFYNNLLNMILETPNFIDRFEKIIICGGSDVISNIEINNKSSKILIKTLSNQDYLEELETASHCIMASGLGNYIETLGKNKEILYLPSINYSQFLQFKYYQKLNLGFKLMNWNIFDFFSDVPELLDEESGVNLVVENIKKFLKIQPKFIVQKEIAKYLNSSQKKYYKKRKNIINSYKKNSSKEVANNIYEDLLKEDDNDEGTK